MKQETTAWVNLSRLAVIGCPCNNFFVVVFFVVIAVCYLCHVVIVLVCHVVTKIVLDKMGHLLTLLDKMGLDETGLDKMGWQPTNSLPPLMYMCSGTVKRTPVNWDTGPSDKLVNVEHCGASVREVATRRRCNMAALLSRISTAVVSFSLCQCHSSVVSLLDITAWWRRQNGAGQ